MFRKLSSILLLLLPLFCHAQLSPQRKAAIDTLDKIIFNKQLQPKKVYRIIYDSGLWRSPLNEAEFNYLDTKIQQRTNASDSVYEKYLCYALEVQWYSQNGRVGKALVAADKFRVAAEQSRRRECLVDSYELTGNAYLSQGMPTEALPYFRNAYFAVVADHRSDSVQARFAGRYSWALNQAWIENRDSVIIDSSIYYRKLSNAYDQRKIREGKAHVYDFTEGSLTLMLALARRKNYPELISYARYSYHIVDSLSPEKTKYTKKALAQFLGYISKAYLGMRVKDSAFYYLNKALAIDKNAIYLYDGPAFYHARFGEYDKAAPLLNEMFASDSVIPDYATRIYLYGIAAPIYENAGMYKEASFCYGKAKLYNDSIEKVSSKMRQDYERTSIALQIANAKETDRLLQEEKNQEIEKQKERSNLILTSVAIISVLLLIFLGVMYNRFKITRRQKNTIEAQKQEVDNAFRMLDEKNTEVIDSINYAKRIQNAILPEKEEVESCLPSAFISYFPKAIVAGDFYWLQKKGNDVLVAAADCTGHGVPGAFMSLIGSKELKIASSVSSSPGQILQHVNRGLKETLRQNNIDRTRDGMDIALMKISGTTISFSGANRPLWIIRKDETQITELKGTKASAGGTTPDEQVFAENELQLAAGDTLYIFSDGYADQFGGEKQKKMTTRRFRELLEANALLPMEQQQAAVENYLQSWRGGLEQVDDILVIGIRL